MLSEILSHLNLPTHFGDEPMKLKDRKLDGLARIWERILLTCIPIVGIMAITDVLSYFGTSVWSQQYLALSLGLTLALIFLRSPATKKSINKLTWSDILFSFAGLLVGLYPAIFYPRLILGIGVISLDKWILGAITIFLILECCRRCFGWPLVIIVASMILYACFTDAFPGALHGNGIPWDRLITHLYIDEGALFGIAIDVVVTIVFAFILFGQLLSTVGGGNFFSDIAMSLFGKYRGGPAKVAVIASGLLGTIQGSPVANVATTGIITIPLMKRSGFPPEFAGAVEATASTGAQIMPPVMGTVAFLIAAFLLMPYSAVVKAAVIPAMLYYLAVFIQVDLRAAKMGFKGLPKDMLPTFRKVFGSGWLFLIPFVVLFYGLFVLLIEPDKVGLYITAATIIVSFFKKSMWLNIRRYLEILENAGAAMLDITLVAGAAGLILGVVSITGLGFSFSSALIQLSGGHFPILLLLAATGAIILGMGMTVAASYIVIVILLAPALTHFGMIPIAAHMFIFYYAVLSFLTPPVCMAVYTAASIADAEPIKTAIQAMRLGIVAYLVPLGFAYSPALLLEGTFYEIFFATITSVAAIALLSASFEGYGLRMMRWPGRILLAIAGIGLLLPFIASRVGGVIICLPFIVYELLIYYRNKNKLISLEGQGRKLKKYS
jgi:TRAP transporter 4TM/12TM fusion protein